MGASLALVVRDCLSELVARAALWTSEGNVPRAGYRDTEGQSIQAYLRKATEVSGAVNGRRMVEGEVREGSRFQVVRAMIERFNFTLIKSLCLLNFSPIAPPYSLGSPSQCLCWMLLFPISRY